MGIPYVGGAARALLGGEESGIAGAGMPPIIPGLGASRGLGMGPGRIPKTIPSGGAPINKAQNIQAAMRSPPLGQMSKLGSLPTGQTPMPPANIALSPGMNVRGALSPQQAIKVIGGGGAGLGKVPGSAALKPTARIPYEKGVFDPARAAAYPITKSAAQKAADMGRLLAPQAPRVPGGMGQSGNLAMLRTPGGQQALATGAVGSGIGALYGAASAEEDEYQKRQLAARDANTAYQGPQMSLPRPPGPNMSMLPGATAPESAAQQKVPAEVARAIVAKAAATPVATPVPSQPAPGHSGIVGDYMSGSEYPAGLAARLTATPRTQPSGGYEVKEDDMLSDIVVADFISKGIHNPTISDVTARWKQLQKEIGLDDPRNLKIGTSLPSIAKGITPKGQWQKMFGKPAQEEVPPAAIAQRSLGPIDEPQPGWEKAAGWDKFKSRGRGEVPFVPRKPPSRVPKEEVQSALDEINVARDTSGIPTPVLEKEPRLAPTSRLPATPAQETVPPSLLGTPAPGRVLGGATSELNIEDERRQAAWRRAGLPMQKGGGITGGIPGKDSVNILAQQGEYVLPKPVVDAIQTGQPPPQGNAPFVDLFREWQPQTPEGERYKQELGAALAAQSAPAGGMKKGGKVKGYQYGGLIGAIGGQGAAGAGRPPEKQEERGRGYAAPRRKPARQTYRQSDPTGGATFRKRGPGLRPTHKQSDPTGGAWIRKPGTYQATFSPQKVNESAFQRPVAGQVPLPSAAAHQRRQAEAQRRYEEQQEELRRAHQRTLLSYLGAGAAGAGVGG